MARPTTLLLSTMTALLHSTILFSETPTPQSQAKANSTITSDNSIQSFTPFTGKVIKNKVRLRLNPNLEGPIVKELMQGDMLIVVGETDEFYVVLPPEGMKGYIFRTFVLDNTVEGSRVNVRLEPDLEAPVLVQMRSGDKIDGIVSPLNSKWLEITTPDTTRFYVAKNYLDNIGDSSVMAAMNKRKTEVNILLNNTYLASQAEIQKSFPEINLDSIYGNLNTVITNYKDFPEQVARAKEILSSIQNLYTQKKIVHLETKTKSAQEDWQTKNSQLNDQMKSQQKTMSELVQQLKKSGASDADLEVITKNNLNIDSTTTNNKMTAWLPAEKMLFDAWSSGHEDKTEADFYQEQANEALAIRGILEPYNRVIKNKPGDYVPPLKGLCLF